MLFQNVRHLYNLINLIRLLAYVSRYWQNVIAKTFRVRRRGRREKRIWKVAPHIHFTLESLFAACGVC